MFDYFNDNNLLAEQQYGFRKLHSTEFAAVKLADYISKQMEYGNIPCSLYISWLLVPPSKRNLRRST